MRPFLKWAGNKYRLVNQIVPLLPEGKRLVEPFAGSGAVFLNSHFKKALLAETNADLVSVYIFLKENTEEFVQDVKKWFKPRYNTQKQYYRLRKLFNETDDTFLKAALFIYLNRHGFNGLCRYNKSGIYNVPFGQYDKPCFPEEQLYYFSEKLEEAEVICSSFEHTMRQARKGDVVYCDPPYVPLSSTSNFTQYYFSSFAEKEQELLADLAKKLSAKGIPVLISNHDTPVTRKLYSDAQCSYFSVQRSISCNGARRIKVPEVLAFYNKV